MQTLTSTGPQRPSPPGEARRQIVTFSFHKIAPEWRRLPRPEREEHCREFASMLRRWARPDEMKVLTYSTAGLRADCDIMLWRICYSLECQQEMSKELLSTALGGYVTTPHRFLAMTRHNIYHIGREHHGQIDPQGGMNPGTLKYLFVHPLVRTREWYQLELSERQRMINDILKLWREYPRVKLSPTYSFGLDDQDFVMSYESDSPADIVDLTMKLRETEAAMYVKSDTPAFTCVRCSIEEMLERIG